MGKIRVAVIGTGKLGAIHARIYSQLADAKLVGICDIDKKKAKGIALNLHTESYTDYHQLISKVDAVSIAVPTILHYCISRDFLNHKVHCLIEKPVTANLKEAEKLLALAKKKNCILQVGHIERFNPAIQVIAKLPGAPRFIECHRLGQFAPRVKDIGVVLDLMIHDIDIVLALVKSKIESIDAIGVKVLTEHEDIASVRIKFQNGAIANLTASRVSDETMRKIRIFKENTYISLDYAQQKAVIYHKIKNKIVSENIPIRKNEPLRLQLESFIHCIQQGKRPLVSGQDAYRALGLAFQILKKIKLNG
jgi:predicted dehydrogenase